jgi:hypothetical protein
VIEVRIKNLETLPPDNYIFSADFFSDPPTGVVGFAAPGFGRSAAKNCSTGSVLITSDFSSHPRRAVATPCRMNGRCSELCESVEITTLHATLFAHPQIDIFEVQPVRIRIAFHCHAILRAGQVLYERKYADRVLAGTDVSATRVA